MTLQIKNLATDTIFILLNDNTLVPLAPQDTLEPVSVEDINNNFVVQKLQECGLISVQEIRVPQFVLN